jgi:aryl-alcohol dehydrogenase-like predicted oxidoreductase
MSPFSISGCRLQPSPICLGTGPLGSSLSKEESFALLDAYLDLGGNFLDTARCYADWLPGERSASEKTIGRWIRERKNRDKIVLATKGAHPEFTTTPVPRLARTDIEFDLNESLKNLQTDVIDLYWLHRDDPARPVEDIMDTLADQVRSGKIRSCGCSNWTLPRIRAAQVCAARQGWSGFVGNQMRWSLAVAAPAKPSDMVAMDEPTRLYHRDTQLAAIPYSSQAGGWFQKRADFEAGKRPDAPGGSFSTDESERLFRRIQTITADSGLTVTQVALGWLLSQPFPTFPIVGSHTIAQLRDCMSAAAVRLSPSQMQILNS